MITAIVTIIFIGIFSALAFWRPNPILFMILGGVSMMLGLSIPDLISSTSSTTSMDFTLGFSFIAYSLFCLAMSYRLMFYSENAEEDD